MKEVDYVVPKYPYPGLLSYDERYQWLFAGRLEDKLACAEKLQLAKILLLHGSSGCGKSSFLRAGFKPYIDLEWRRWFAITELTEAPGNLFVRSGPDPLSTLARCLFDFRNAYKEGTCHLPTMKAPDAIFKDYINADAFLSAMSDKYETFPYEMLEALSALRSITDIDPIIVIDQAEEVITMHEEPIHREAFASFFTFLVALSQEPIDVRLCIAMRTEYKGQFDDQLEEHGLELEDIRGQGIRGHFLKALEPKHLVQAILAPTTFAQYNFNIPLRVAEKIAKAVATRVEPPGGMLPVLQVICKRLYDYPTGESDKTVPRTITEDNFRQLGTVRQQIARYLDEKLNDLVSIIRDDSTADATSLPDDEHEIINVQIIAQGATVSPEDTSDKKDAQINHQIDAWRLLLRKLVVEQPDGRATATWVSVNDLASEAALLGLQGVRPQDLLMTRLSWLADERVSLIRGPDSEGRWTLGHDSLGLVLLQKQRSSKRMVYDLADFERRALGRAKRIIYIISGSPMVPDEGSPLWNSIVYNIHTCCASYNILVPLDKGEPEIQALRASFSRLAACATARSSHTQDALITVAHISRSAHTALQEHSWKGAPHIAYSLPTIPYFFVLCGTGEHESIPEPYLILSRASSEWLYRDVISTSISIPLTAAMGDRSTG